MGVWLGVAGYEACMGLAMYGKYMVVPWYEACMGLANVWQMYE
jgi:hypothetical protein